MRTKKSDNNTPIELTRGLHELRAKSNEVLVSPQAQTPAKPGSQETYGRVPLIPLLCEANGHSKARPELASVSGLYPAIDRILARKQRLARLQDSCSQTPAGTHASQQISKHSSSVSTLPSCSSPHRISSPKLSNAAQQVVQLKRSVQAMRNPEADIGCQKRTAHAHVNNTQQLTSVRMLSAAASACHGQVNCRHRHNTAAIASCCQQQPALSDAANTHHAFTRQGGPGCRIQATSVGPSSCASDAAQKQYTYFKFSRQQRHAAAVTIQRHVRGLLARALVQQLQKLRLHAKQRQQHMLSLAMLSWREHAAMHCALRARVRERSFRYGLWQHCHLHVQFDADAVFRQEGKAVMAAQYRAWRTKAVITTRWQQLSIHHGD